MTARAVVPVLAVVLAACAAAGGGVDGEGPAAAPDADPGTATDTLRGTVTVVGAEPMTRVVLRTGQAAVALEGPAAETLRRVDGLVVRVDGRRDGAAMTVTGFRVREVDGLPAVDGTLELDGDTAVLVTPGGQRVRFTPVPSALRSRVGARVWIAGHAGDEPQAWGVIQE